MSAEYTITVLPKDAGMLILTMDGENVTRSTVSVDLNTESVIILDAENLDDATAVDVTWKSSNKKIASVEDGVVIIHTKGSAVITATAADGRKAIVTLKIAALTSTVTIREPENGLEVASGKALTLKAVCEDGASSKVTWSIVEGAQYAKIASNGKLTANKDITSAKEVRVRATAADGSGKKVTFKLKVIRKVEGLFMEDQTVKGGKSLNLAKLITIDPKEATNKKLTWTITSGSAYATISGGTLKAKKVVSPQTVEVTVRSQDGGASTVFYVTITP